MERQTRFELLGGYASSPSAWEAVSPFSQRIHTCLFPRAYAGRNRKRLDRIVKRVNELQSLRDWVTRQVLKEFSSIFMCGRPRGIGTNSEREIACRLLSHGATDEIPVDLRVGPPFPRIERQVLPRSS